MLWKLRIPCVFSLLCFFPASVSFAGTEVSSDSVALRTSDLGGGARNPSVQDNDSRHLGLRDCITVALRNNLDIAVTRIEEMSSHDDVETARAAFDPAFFTDAGHNVEAGLFGELDTGITEVDSGITMNTITGATVKLSADVVRSVNSLNTLYVEAISDYESDLALTIRQPLLKGAGTHVNRIPIELGLLNVSQADLTLRKSVLDLLENTESAYWQLMFAVRERKIYETSLSLSQRLVDETQARVKVGLATGVETTQAQAALAAKREAVILANQSVDDKKDALLLLLGKLGKDQLTIDLPDEFPPPGQTDSLDSSKILQLVRQLPEYAIELKVIKEHQLMVDKAVNDALPQLDLTAGGGPVGGAGGLGGSVSQVAHSNHEDWQVLLEMRIPIGFRGEHAALRQSRYELEVENLRLRDLEQQLESQIRSAARGVAAGGERVRVTNISLQVSQQEYDQLFAKFKQGLATFRDTLLAQDDLETARLDSTQAQLDDTVAAIALARLDGTLPARNHLVWSP